MKKYMKRFTVFTPTYNRGYLLENVYRSLQRQTFKDFEWVVVDDGSTDNTLDMLKEWSAEENFFPIVYCAVENGGKHRAINKAVSMARGELFFIVDSDDYLTKTALETADRVEKSIDQNQKSQFCGICGQKGYADGRAVGTIFPGEEYLDITHIERDVYKLDGDKAEIFYTDAMKKYPFPEIDGEKFLIESIVWERMAHDGYRIRYFNDIIYICEYLPDGLTKKSAEILTKNPKGYALSICQRIDFGIIAGIGKWNARWRYHRQLKDVLSTREIAWNLKLRPITLVCGLLCLRVYSRFCSFLRDGG